ncbi:MAG: hypothetical protein H3C34_18145 [Caldilineaceae bacterium]|nr:hypothetical protein [Caldilineaceae bacterium]
MIRKSFFILTTTVLVLAVFAGLVSALDEKPVSVVKTNLENVRAYTAATSAAGISYAVDGGELFAGRPGEWRKVTTPAGVIVGSVAVDSAKPGVVYIGAANELALYRTEGRKASWTRIPLDTEQVGGVISLAMDSANHLIYAGTDTAGIYRLRDVGSSVIAGGHTQLDEPVVQLATDSTGAGLAFARTPSNLYRAESLGLEWSTVQGLGSAPTALAIANRYPATVYVGTADRGVVTSQDGVSWTLANDGLGLVPGSRLYVDALAVDPAQLEVIYVATSYLYGSTTTHHSPVGVALSTNGGASWSALAAVTDVAVAELLPLPDQTGAVYAVTVASRKPVALGTAPAIAASAPVVSKPDTGLSLTTILAWTIAALAGIALAFALVTDLRHRTKVATGSKALAKQPVSNSR